MALLDDDAKKHNSYSPDRLIHRQVDKAKIYRDTQPLWWSKELGRWLCCDTALIKEVLCNDNFKVIDYLQGHNILTSNLKIDLDHIANLYANLPMCHDGEHHKKLRRIYAKKIAAQFDRATEKFETTLGHLIATQLRPNITLDLVGQIIVPALVSATSVLSDVACPYENNMTSIGQILDETIGVSRRKVINQRVDDILHAIPNDNCDEMQYIKIGLAITGLDSLAGAISESLGSILGKNPHLTLAQIAWDQFMPATSVPFTERTASKDINIGAIKIQAGQKIRLYLDAAGYSQAEPSYSNLYFGAGGHTCIGKSLSDAFWKILIATLSGVHLKICIIESRRRDHDYFFNGYCQLICAIQ